MKKILFILIGVFMLKQSTFAQELDGYDYKGIVNNCQNDVNTICKPITYNKFYKKIITDSLYEKEDYISESYPYKDETNIKTNEYLTKEKTGNNLYHTNRINFGYEIDSISFENVNQENITIYYDGEILNLEPKFINNYLIYSFNHVINPTNLKVLINNSVNPIIRLYLNNNIINQDTIKNEDSLNLFIDYLDTLEYKSLLEELNLEYSSNKFSADYYKTMDILYLYYNYEKEYYMDLTDSYLEGYEFDPNESYTLYEKYEKKEEKKVEDIYTFNKTITPVKTNLKNTLKPKNVGNALKNVDAGTNITGDEKNFNLKKPIIYKKTVKQQTQNSLKKKYYLPIFILLFIVLRKFYVKFKYKNAT